jgi:hypothetical protein
MSPRWVVMACGASLLLICVIIVAFATHSGTNADLDGLGYFVAAGVPHGAVLIGLRRGSRPGVLALAAGVSCMMGFVYAAYGVLGFVMAPWNFGGYAAPDWYWVQWSAGCALVLVQIVMVCAAYVPARRLSSTWSAVAGAFVGVCITLLYLVGAATALRLVFQSR